MILHSLLTDINRSVFSFTWLGTWSVVTFEHSNGLRTDLKLVFLKSLIIIVTIIYYYLLLFYCYIFLVQAITLCKTEVNGSWPFTRKEDIVSMKIEGRRRDRSTSFLLSQQSVRRVPRYRPATKGRPPYRTTVPLHITHKDEETRQSRTASWDWKRQ